MSFFSSGPSLTEVNQYSIRTIDQAIGSALHTRCVDREAFDQLLTEFEAYWKTNRLGMVKKAKMMGNIELFLSQAVSSPERHEFMKAVKARFT
jgi:hypothetical protein